MRKKRETLKMLNLLQVYLYLHKVSTQKEKIEISNKLATFVEVARREYGLTSAYYIPAEYKAKKNYEEKNKCK